MQKIVNGDIIEMAVEGKFDIIVHGCNCFNTMGSGIARQIKTVFPQAYEIDCQSIRGSKDKLGSFTYATVHLTNARKSKIIIANAYTQYNYGKGGLYVDYDAVENSMKLIDAYFPLKLSVAYPKIGAGLAGGDWSIIDPILRNAFSRRDQTLVLFD